MKSMRLSKIPHQMMVPKMLMTQKKQNSHRVAKHESEGGNSIKAAAFPVSIPSTA
jgi:hypothetical protein